MAFTALLPNYLPDIHYFTYFLPCTHVLIADHLQFQKRSPIVRNKLTSNSQLLSIPVIHNGYKKAIFQKQIAFIENWNQKHLKTIHHLFNTAPYFDEIYPDIYNLLIAPAESLTTFLTNFISLFIKKLKIDVAIIQTSQLNFNDPLETELIKFARGKQLTRYYHNQNQTKYKAFNFLQLNEARIKTMAFPSVKSNEIAKMNILDFLFQYGPEAAFIMRDMV